MSHLKGLDAARDAESLAKFPTYEDYLEAQITSTDMKYLQDEELARELVELGYRGSGEVLKREEFEARKRELEESKGQARRKTRSRLCSAGIDITGFPFLSEMAKREERLRSGKLTSIVFIRDRKDKRENGQEISGYIDLAYRMKTEDFRPYFLHEKCLLPRPSDLSYYNWETQTSTSNPTPNFQVIADNESGLLFKNKRDRKVINVDPEGDSGDNSKRSEILTDEYIQVVFYDHETRRKS